MLDAMLALSNRSRKPKDPCFTGLELWKRLNDVALTVIEARSLVGSGFFSQREETKVERINDKHCECIEAQEELVADLMRIKDHLKDLQEILSDDSTTADVGLNRLRLFRDRMTKRKKSADLMKIESDFCDALVKFVNAKGELLLNHKRVDGAPRTNNEHELFYKQLKHVLRKVTGFGAASTFLLGHGERIVYVKIDEPAEKIREIFLNMELAKGRESIALERKSRDMIQHIMHDDDKWNQKIEKLMKMIHEFREKGIESMQAHGK